MKGFVNQTQACVAAAQNVHCLGFIEWFCIQVFNVQLRKIILLIL